MKKYLSVFLVLMFFVGAIPAQAASLPTLQSLYAQLASLSAELTRLVSLRNVAAITGAGTPINTGGFVTAISATPTASTPTAPFALTGSFSSISSRGSVGCFQVRTTSTSYGTACTSPAKTVLPTSTIVGATSLPTPISYTTTVLQPGTTYFFRVKVSDALISSVQVFSNEISFTTPAAPVPVVVPPVVTTPKPVTPAPVVVKPTPVSTVSSAKVTVVGTSLSTNIIPNIPNQTFGTFTVGITGEPVSFKGITFHSNPTGDSGPGAGDIDLVTNVTLVNSNGVVVAGPVDAVIGKAESLVVFTDSIRIALGTTTLSLKGRIRATASSGQKIRIDTTPSLDWSMPLGQTSGKKVVLPTNKVVVASPIIKTANITVKTVPVSGVSMNPLPLLPGSNGRLFQVYSFDATQSAEDIRVSSLSLLLNVENGASQTMLSNCALQVADGTPRLNTGSNSVNPVASAKNGTQNIFTLDKPFVVKKGTTGLMQLMCNVSSSAKGSFAWGLNEGSSLAAIGVESGSSVKPVIVNGLGTLAPVAVSTLTLGPDASFPISSNIAPGLQGIAGIPVGFVKLRAVGQSMNLERIGLHLATGSPQDLIRVTVFDGSTQVGSVVFTGSNRFATSTLVMPLSLVTDTDKVLTIKADFAPMMSGAVSHPIQLGVTGGVNTRAIGISSGTIIDATGSVLFAPVNVIAPVQTGTLSVSVDPSSPTGRAVVSGEANVTVGVVKLRAIGEPINVERMGLQLFATSTQSLVRVKVFDGSTQIGVAVFDGNSRFATSTFAQWVMVPQDSDKKLTLKADFAQVGPSQPGLGGDVVSLGVTSGVNTVGSGVDSGNRILATGSAFFAPFRLPRAFSVGPVVTVQSFSPAGLVNGTNDLLRFNITAPSTGNIGIGKLVPLVSTTSAAISAIQIIADSTGPLVFGNGTMVQIPAGQTKSFTVRGVVSVMNASSSVKTVLKGDFFSVPLGTLAQRISDSQFVWSFNSSGASLPTDSDWSNGVYMTDQMTSTIGQSQIRIR